MPNFLDRKFLDKLPQKCLMCNIKDPVAVLNCETQYEYKTVKQYMEKAPCCKNLEAGSMVFSGGPFVGTVANFNNRNALQGNLRERQRR